MEYKNNISNEEYKMYKKKYGKLKRKEIKKTKKEPVKILKPMFGGVDDIEKDERKNRK